MAFRRDPIHGLSPSFNSGDIEHLSTKSRLEASPWVTARQTPRTAETEKAGVFVYPELGPGIDHTRTMSSDKRV